MINTWFTSDLHFNHRNILEYEKEARPFTTVEEMNERLIHNWNSVVHDNDIVYILGDFCINKTALPIAGLLHGKKRLVLGNHDTFPTVDYLVYFEKLYGMTYWKKCILSHMPVHPDCLGSRAFLNLHGHWHSRKVKTTIHDFEEMQIIKYADDPNYFNVAVENHNLTPVHSDVIMERLKELE